ncbi:geminin isoform X2 [Anoplophora glabripennis]|uniref:geminin isoform X2 n=1 Tax=Anoplophora glabripennis TaxID=217634 RepID=UPI0008746241|nr:geminin isoform X2 [Anoplophora glabripennis]
MMKTEKKVIIRVESEEQDNAKNSRRTMKVIQHAATDKENLVGRPQILKDAKASVLEKRRKLLMQSKSTQTGECVITAEDLTSDEPSTDYWRKLAETRGESLNRSMQENEKLKEDIEALQEENKICKEMLEESKNLVDVLQELLDEKDEDDDIGEKAT